MALHYIVTIQEDNPVCPIKLNYPKTKTAMVAANGVLCVYVVYLSTTVYGSRTTGISVHTLPCLRQVTKSFVKKFPHIFADIFKQSSGSLSFSAISHFSSRKGAN